MVKIVALDRFGSLLAVRRTVSELLADVPDDASLELDFSGVEFMSRSFCDELLARLERRSAPYQLSGTGASVAQMLATVREHRAHVDERPVPAEFDVFEIA